MGRLVLRTPPRRAFAAGLTVTLALASAAACSSNALQPAASQANSFQTTGAVDGSTPASADAATTAIAPSSAAPATKAAVVPAHGSGGGVWHPTPGLTWQWQLTEPVDTSINAQVYDIDGVDNSAVVVSELHAAGRKVICYVNAGAYENFRPDASRFPSALLGLSDGWPGENWLDIRQLDALRPIMAARFKICQQKGFDGIEADNVDGYTNDTGFPLTAADQLAYNRMLAGLAHADGLAIGLKNDLDQVQQLLPDFDFSIDEQCAEYSECSELEPFVKSGKAVFEAEYNVPLSEFCGQSESLGFSAILKDTALDATRQACPTS